MLARRARARAGAGAQPVHVRHHRVPSGDVLTPAVPAPTEHVVTNSLLDSWTSVDVDVPRPSTLTTVPPPKCTTVRARAGV